MDIITRKGWLSSIAQTDEHPQFGTAYAVVKGYDPARDGARQPTTNLEIVVRRPNGQQALVYVLAENAGYSYAAGVPVQILNTNPLVAGDQIDGKAGPSGIGWRVNGDLEIAANLRVVNGGVARQAWVRCVLRCGDDGKWREV